MNFFPVDDDGMAGVVAAGVTSDRRRNFPRERRRSCLYPRHPLGTHDDRSLPFFNGQLRDAG